MATPNKPTPGGSEKADEAAHAPAKTSSSHPAASHPTHETVIVEEKKKKRRYSGGLRGIQNLERGAAKSLDTLARGAARMFEVYNVEREKSSRKKRDGALRDGLANWAKAMSKGLRVAGDAPYDFIKTVNKGKGSKRLRKTVRIFIPPPLR
jgi:hypothetical protein